ncbi:MAG: zinc-dependent dehydrogenase [Candidatus Firestonebacteria bacterium]
MKAAVFEGIEKIVVKEVNKPVCGEDNILIKVKACAICGTDVRTYHHGKSNVEPPQIIGHEISGIIEEIGKKIKNFKVSDKIAVAAIVSCGKCYYCKKGMSNLCESFTAIGYEHPGGFAEYMLVPAEMILDGSVNKIPDNISFDEAALAEPFACAINGQELSRVSNGDKVVIVGAGPIGCMHIAIAKSKGAEKVILIELSPERIEMAKKFKADVYINASIEDPIKRVLEETNNRGADVIMVATSSAKVQEMSLKMIGFRGRINFFGGLPKDKPYITLDSNIIHYKEVFINGTSGSLPRHNQEALKLFGLGKVHSKDFITHRLPLEKLVEGLGLVESGKGLKVVINP